MCLYLPNWMYPAHSLQCICAVSHCVALAPSLPFSKLFIFHCIISLWFSVSTNFFHLSCIPSSSSKSLSTGQRREKVPAHWAETLQSSSFSSLQESPPSSSPHPPVVVPITERGEERKKKHRTKEREWANTKHWRLKLNFPWWFFFCPCPWPLSTLLLSNTSVVSWLVFRLLIGIHTVSFWNVALSRCCSDEIVRD